MFHKEIVAIHPGAHTMRIVYDSKLETFFFQEKIFFVWTNKEYTFDVERVRQWRDHHRLAWVSQRWAS